MTRVFSFSIFQSVTISGIVSFLATVSFNMNPAQNGGPSLAVLPVEAIPCKIAVGKKIYIVKDKEQDVPVISCEKKK